MGQTAGPRKHNSRTFALLDTESLISLLLKFSINRRPHLKTAQRVSLLSCGVTLFVPSTVFAFSCLCFADSDVTHKRWKKFDKRRSLRHVTSSEKPDRKPDLSGRTCTGSGRSVSWQTVIWSKSIAVGGFRPLSKAWSVDVFANSACPIASMLVARKGNSGTTKITS